MYVLNKEVVTLLYSAVMEKLNDALPGTLSRIHSSLASVLSLIHASPESPAWDKYLHRVEKQVTEGLSNMVLTAVGSLLHRAHLYEQVLYVHACTIPFWVKTFVN